MPMHFFGGLWLSIIFFHFIYPRLQITNYQLLITIILALGFVAIVGVLWEFFEFLFDVFISQAGYHGSFQMMRYGVKDLYTDTLSDLFFDLLGGLVFTIFAFGKK